MRQTSTRRRLPLSGNAALWASAVIQAVLGIEFVLSGLSKLADASYAANFRAFVQASPGSHRGILAPVVQALILPHAALAGELARFTELGAGIALLIAAAEIGRRRFAGRLGAEHGYEPGVALLGAAAGLTVAGVSLVIYLLQGGTVPGVSPARAFAAPITIELMNVPLGLAIAWLETGRFAALRKSRAVAGRNADTGRATSGIEGLVTAESFRHTRRA
jgi:uncharacterized membrane protein YphA (DoxX/SURF4 family)